MARLLAEDAGREAGVGRHPRQIRYTRSHSHCLASEEEAVCLMIRPVTEITRNFVSPPTLQLCCGVFDPTLSRVLSICHDAAVHLLPL